MSFLNIGIWKLLISPTEKSFIHPQRLFINENEINIRLFESSVNSNEKSKKSYRSKYFLAESAKNKELAIKKRKLILVFPGRNCNFRQPSKLMYIRKLYETNELNEFDIAILIYPSKAKSIGHLAQSCQLVLKSIIESGYEQKNISIIGWCLGSYFANETLKIFVHNNNSNASVNAKTPFNVLINNKSFTSINEFLFYYLPKSFRSILSLYPIKSNVETWNSDSIHSLSLCEDSFDKIFIIYSDKDRVVKGYSHLYKHLNENEKIEIKQDQERVDHKPNWKMMAQLIASSALNSS